MKLIQNKSNGGFFDSLVPRAMGLIGGAVGGPMGATVGNALGGAMTGRYDPGVINFNNYNNNNPDGYSFDDEWEKRWKSNGFSSKGW